MKDKLEAIRKSCIEANPEIGGPESVRAGTILRHRVDGWETVACGPADKHGGVSHENGYGPLSSFGIVASRPIRLADVLLACGADGIGTDTPHDLIGILVLWNYWGDDLTQQSDECISFLYELLKPSV